MVKGKRALLANVLYHSGVEQVFRQLDHKNLVIFNYHRIRLRKNQEIPFDEGVYGPTQEEFYSQLRWLKTNSNIISETELIDHLDGRTRIPHASVMITFDDGYRDNAELALPILRELEIPAIFFICTQVMEKRELGWWDNIAYLIKQSRRSKVMVRGRTFDLLKQRSWAIRELQERMRTESSENTLHLIEEIASACDVKMPSIEQCSNELMTWDQVLEAQKSGMTIGSHTHTHRVLSTLSRAEQINEFKTSKTILESRLGTSIRSVAYPVGGYDDCHVETGELAENCGYKLGFTFQTGFNSLDNLSAFGMRRTSSEETIPLTCAAIRVPSLFTRSRTGDRPMRTLASQFASHSVLKEKFR